MIHEIHVPWLNADEEVVLLVEWHAEEGKHIAEGDPLCTLETSKVAAEIEAEDSGFLKRAVEAGSSVPVESVIGWIADSPEELKTVRPGPRGSKSDSSVKA